METGIKHGTITVLAGEYPVELTTFRGESGYADGRHPDHVTFGVTLQEDLARRDFTIGAMAWDTERGCLIDPFGGQRDLENRLIRAVGDPDRRFAEDGLRILRGLRFAATLGFSIEPETAGALRRNADRLRGLSPERVKSRTGKAAVRKSCRAGAAGRCRYYRRGAAGASADGGLRAEQSPPSAKTFGSTP